MPSYNYRCKECGGECVYTTRRAQELTRDDLWCEQCGSPEMQLIEYSLKEDLQGKKIVAEIVDLNERIGTLVTAIEDIRKRIECIEDFSPDFLVSDDSLLN